MLCLLAACLLPPLAIAAKQTVCTITINSADEQKVFRRFLPADKYEFVELVERKRSDWLASACQAKVACDVLVISGHYGEGNEFFSDVMENHESLPIAELERVSCSDSCPSLFANLKEVYLFGCDTLNPHAQHTTSAEIVRSFVREGRTQADAARLAQQLIAQRGESSRDRMRLVFKDVPVIYGFSSAAPVGPVAAGSLTRFFQTSGAGEVGKGRASGGLLRQFSAQGLAAARGMTAGDSLAATRQDVCMFADDRLSEAQRLDGIHELLQRPTAESRMLLDRIERSTAALDAATRQQPEVAQALERIARDTDARKRYLAFARDADEPQTRSRMIHIAHALGWLSREERRDELVRMFTEMLERKTILGTEVDLACRVNKEHELDGALDEAALPSGRAEDVAHSAVRACMGNAQAHARTLKGLIGPDEDVRIAQTYLRHRPIADTQELRAVTAAIAAMPGSEAQARALDVLARHYVSDRESVDTLKQLFAKTRSWPVQNAIAGVLIRADPRTITGADLLRTLREYRLKSSPQDNMVDALIQRLQLS
ncbi:hypothetical protein [Ramlibacter alkalitolerans]|uniref:Caspase domain-containing protein n=1 Tax=Ramlibacter alkalitolerans TaxID=2039631 RepID=A0ABS1JJM1_9BURK|nr:hypothetical protein [Ramlibacter alkalitolerans]MBL0424126.1 hypothetical protein [Ramlibacter alkalitolerans]